MACATFLLQFLISYLGMILQKILKAMTHYPVSAKIRIISTPDLLEAQQKEALTHDVDMPLVIITLSMVMVLVTARIMVMGLIEDFILILQEGSIDSQRELVEPERHLRLLQHPKTNRTSTGRYRW